jgi:protein-disulfide isomerase
MILDDMMPARISRLTRHSLFAGLAAAVLLLTGCGQSSNTKTAESTASSSNASSGDSKSVLGAAEKIEQLPDMTLGNKDAPIKIIEYASMTCPHCAHFDAEVLPELEKNYIDTGKVFYTFREFPLDGVALRASMVARCVGKDRFFSFIHGLFHTQYTWANPDLWNNKDKTVDEKLVPLATIAKEQAGMNQADFDKCVHDQTLQEQITMQAKRGVDDFKVNGTPSVYIDGKPFEAVGSYEDLDTRLKEVLGEK